MVDKIWVFAESAEGKATSATLEILTKARELGSTVEAIYTGSDTDAVATAVGEYGATKLFVIDPGDGLPGQVAAAPIAELAGEHKPDAILFAQSYDGRDAIARLSVKLDRPVLTNGMSLSGEGGLLFGTGIFGGVTLVDAKFSDGGPALIAALLLHLLDAAEFDERLPAGGRWREALPHFLFDQDLEGCAKFLVHGLLEGGLAEEVSEQTRYASWHHASH